MRRRPWPIVILAFLQIVVEPFSNVLLNSYWSALSPRAYVDWYLEHHDWISLFYVIGLPILMGAAVYAMKRWSYPVFAAGACWMLVRDMQLVEAGLLPLWVSIALLAGNLAFVGYFLLPAVAAPYLNPRLRWWESKPRYRVDYRGRFEPEGGDSLPCRFRNLSVGGAFVDCQAPAHARAAPTDSTGWLRMHVPGSAGDELMLPFRVRIAFSRGTGPRSLGFGLQFIEMNAETRAELLRLIRDLRRSGDRVERNDSAWEDFRIWFWALVRTGNGLIPPRQLRPKAAVAAPGARNSEETVTDERAAS